MEFELQVYMAQKVDQVNRELERMLSAANNSPAKLRDAMHYSLMAGGKRLRAILALAAAEAVGADEHVLKQILPAACAIECLHTYSLIHDDLPAMDDDDMRRGKLTNHKVFGEGIAILAGDALLTLCFELLAGCLSSFPAECVLQIVAEVAHAGGAQGMVGGQAADILWEKERQQESGLPELLSYIHRHKTAALIVASVRIGAILAGAKRQELQALTDYASAFGLAFQITDDLLDVYGDEAKLGKKTGQDSVLGKLTYPAVYGLSASKQKASNLAQAAQASLAHFSATALPLRVLASSLTEREY